MAPKDADVAEVAETKPAVDTTKSEAAEVRAGALAPKVKRYVGIAALAVIGPLAAILLGVYIYLSGGQFIATDNAYVKSAKIAVSADVTGRVTEVAVRENETVQAGALLFRVDPAPFEIALNRAEARLLSAQQGVKALKAIYRQKLAALKRAQSEVKYQKQQYGRQRKLSRKKLVSGLNLDVATRNLRDAEDQVKVAEQELAEARAKLGGKSETGADTHPDVLEAMAIRDQARLDLKRTSVQASLRGVVTNFDLQPGEYVTSGKPIFSLVGVDNTWVHANYKETELTHVRVGQPAKISVDTYPDKTFEAVVSGISPATGAEFALLPPQNATGNWVKVVQRLTVRLRLKGQNEAQRQIQNRAAGDDEAAVPRLRAGMSAIVEIDTGHKRRLTGIFAVVADWVSGLTKGIL